VISISAFNREKQEFMSIGLWIEKGGKFILKNGDVSPFAGSGLTCKIDTTKQNIIRILSYNNLKGLLKGSFEFTCYDNEGSIKDTLDITEGFFDI
jgi:hypothetical protein